jgi:hypothetical protein
LPFPPQTRAGRIIIFIRLGPRLFLRRESFGLHIQELLFDLLVLLLHVLDHFLERLLGGDIDSFLAVSADVMYG